MKSSDIARAVQLTPGDNSWLDASLLGALPILKQLRRSAGGWKFWLRWGMDALIAALEAYLRERGLIS